MFQKLPPEKNFKNLFKTAKFKILEIFDLIILKNWMFSHQKTILLFEP